MKKTFILLAALAATAPAFADDIITLDLTKAMTELSFDAENGSWTETFNDDEYTIDSQCFSFLHWSMGDYFTWWGFTASNATDNSNHDGSLSYQWSNMAKGGIVLNEDGTVKTDEFGSPETSAEVPYIVAFYNYYFAKRPCQLLFNDGKTYEPQGIYVNLNALPYYTILQGDALARPFNNGDKFTLTIHGVAEDESEKEIDVAMAEYANGDLTVNRGWKYVDLTSLGAVNELYFTLDSTDSGAYGMNTPGYFCLDKLSVKEAESSVAEIGADKAGIKYDRAAGTVTLTGADFAAVYDASGCKVMTNEGTSFSIRHLPQGVYVVKAGNNSIKIAK